MSFEKPGGDHPPTVGARITALVAAVVLLAVGAMSVLWVLPAGTPLRAEVVSATGPYYAQTWDVFAPNISRNNLSFEVRAKWRDESGQLVASDWVSVTAVEQRAVTGELTPSRVQKQTGNAVKSYLQRFALLDAEQQARVKDTFIEVHDGGFRPIADDRLIEELGADDSDVIRLLRVDYMLMRYTTLFATAAFGEDIERVQWRTVSTRPNDFLHRFSEEEQFTPTVRTFGWRQSNVTTDESVVAEFRDLIDRYGARDELRKVADDAR